MTRNLIGNPPGRLTVLAPFTVTVPPVSPVRSPPSPWPFPGALPFLTAVDAFLASLENVRTREAYALDLAAFARYAGAQDVDPFAFTRVDAEAFRNALRDAGYAPATIARRLAALRSFFAYCTDVGTVAVSPFARVRPPRVPNVSPREGLTRSEASAMLDAARLVPAHALTVGLLMLLGLRASEVAPLTIADAFTERGHRVLTVRGKGGTVHRLPLPPYVADALDRVIGDRDAGPLLTAPRGGPFDRWAVTAVVRKVAHACGLDPRPSGGRVTPHDLRHAMVTHALAAGSPLHRVQDAARHADPRTTRRYDRAREQLDGHAAYAVAVHLQANP